MDCKTQLAALVRIQSQWAGRTGGGGDFVFIVLLLHIIFFADFVMIVNLTIF